MFGYAFEVVIFQNEYQVRRNEPILMCKQNV